MRSPRGRSSEQWDCLSDQSAAPWFDARSESNRLTLPRVPRTSPLLERAEALAALAPDPRGKYFVGRSWLSFFAAHGRFSGTIVWGEPSPQDVKEWTACADLRISEACAPHATLFDGYRVERLSPGTFGALAGYASRSLAGLSAQITRLAVVHHGGFAGAVASGFTRLVALPFP